MDERRKLGSSIEVAIVKRRLTLRQVSVATGIPKSTLHRWICGEIPRAVVAWIKINNLLPHLFER